MTYILQGGNQRLTTDFKKLNFADPLKDMHRRQKKMANIKEMAKEYEPQQTKNIADLKRVLVDEEIVEKEYTTTKDGKEEIFKVNVITIDEEDYRVPKTVLKGLKAMIEEKPDLVAFKVNKAGEGMNTSYTVIPLEG